MHADPVLGLASGLPDPTTSGNEVTRIVDKAVAEAPVPAGGGVDGGGLRTRS